MPSPNMPKRMSVHRTQKIWNFIYYLFLEIQTEEMQKSWFWVCMCGFFLEICVKTRVPVRTNKQANRKKKEQNRKPPWNSIFHQESTESSLLYHGRGQLLTQLTAHVVRIFGTYVFKCFKSPSCVSFRFGWFQMVTHNYS